jgi:hypothetical protein
MIEGGLMFVMKTRIVVTTRSFRQNNLALWVWIWRRRRRREIYF